MIQPRSDGRSSVGQRALRAALLLGVSFAGTAILVTGARAQSRDVAIDSAAVDPNPDPTQPGYFGQAPGAVTIANARPLGNAFGILGASGTGTTITNSGPIQNATIGIGGQSAAGLVAITNSGPIQFGLAGIGALSGGPVAITNLGTLTQFGATPAAVAANASAANFNAQLNGAVALVARGLNAAPVLTGVGIAALSQNGGLTIVNGAVAAGAAVPSTVTLTATAAGTNATTGTIGGPTIATTANGIGIAAASQGAGAALSIQNSGTIQSGLAGIAAFNTAAGGTIAIANSGVVVSTAGPAVSAVAAGGIIGIANRGVLLGASGIVATGAPGAAITIDNAGQIVAGPGAAIDTRTNGSAVASFVTNAGIVYGQIALGDGSAFTNAATGQVFLTPNRAGAAAFVGGSAAAGTVSTVTNFGTVSLAGAISSVGGAAGAGAATVSTLSIVAPAAGAGVPGVSPLAPSPLPISATLDRVNFINAGVINLGTGSAANQLTINGNYTGVNGQLFLQASTQAGTADRLVITGNAAGSTGITVSNLTPNAMFSTGPVLVQVNGTLAANAFTLTGLRNFGTMEGTLVNGTAVDGAKTISLGAVPNAVAASAPTAVIATRTIATQGGTAVLDRVTQVRDSQQRQATGQSTGLPSQAMQYTALVSKDPIAQNIVPATSPVDTSVRFATWARATGDLERRTGYATTVFNGAGFARDLGYTQQTGALVGGGDAVISGLTSANDGLILGVMGGYSIATVTLNRQAGRQDYDGGSVGAYGTYLNGPFFLDALFKVDLLGLDIVAPGLRQRTGLQNYLFTSNVGYRIPVGGGLYVEPTAGIEYINTDFNRQAALTPTTVPLRDGDAVRGRIGARTGTEILIGDIRIEPSVTGYLYSVLYESRLSGAFNGITSVTGLRDEGKVRGEVQTAVNVFNLKTGLSGFVRADYRIGSDLIAGGGRVGIRYQW
ncbi:autotransporter outer membrane beta-barrel domain-containing protein [Methylobacterium sp. NEAU 140]|uniref:autotransporter outer membrane beta-barrel domain-containing protein n=1 Tax=Methylobacterium sp. NEAU 140 TaxID=3064945 RepID=UPI0027335324|nr:autotransporter outer membrane beta-barrel domain-containing protein [Methylobacterium sp. NEAU 140]MDP4024932.1 autotransporter outer membrane beta-barrel domain-containing protein [Methylobacterium sp. NEAU 140]